MPCASGARKRRSPKPNRLRKTPRQPGASELMNTGRKFPPNHLHDSWLDFLYWDAELEA